LSQTRYYFHGHVKVAGYDTKAVMAENRGMDFWYTDERLASFRGFKDCFDRF
jgi:hypothetical protein